MAGTGIMMSVLCGLSLLVAVGGGGAFAGEAKKFTDDTIGLDLHHDYFYYSDDSVNKAYVRERYLSPKVTLSHSDAPNPFAVAQSTSSRSGSLMDRWDYKQTEYGHQFFALYHGETRPFVVNKLRAQLLRRLANEMQDSLPALDEAYENRAAADYESHVKDVKDSLQSIIERVFADVNSEIVKSMRDNDDSYATATVAIVTKNYVIVANAGDGKVLGYDSTTLMRDLTGAAALVGSPVFRGQRKVFGAKVSQKSFGLPDVAFYDRVWPDFEDDPINLQYFVMQTGKVAERLNGEQTKTVVMSQVEIHKKRIEFERDLQSGTVTSLLQEAKSRAGLSARIFKTTDYSVIFVTLETVYKNIH